MTGRLPAVLDEAKMPVEIVLTWHPLRHAIVFILIVKEEDCPMNCGLVNPVTDSIAYPVGGFAPV